MNERNGVFIMRNKLIDMVREILAIENDLPYRFDFTKENPSFDDFDLEIFDQTWSSTALGFGGIGGQAITTARTYVFLPVTCEQKCFVYFAGKFAYAIPWSEKFLADVRSRNVASVCGSAKYLRE